MTSDRAPRIPQLVCVVMCVLVCMLARCVVLGEGEVGTYTQDTVYRASHKRVIPFSKAKMSFVLTGLNIGFLFWGTSQYFMSGT